MQHRTLTSFCGQIAKMRAIWILVLTSCIALVSSLRPSYGCGHQKPPLPHPGHHHRFDLRYNDANLGEIYRHYILQIPNGKKYKFCKLLCNLKLHYY